MKTLGLVIAKLATALLVVANAVFLAAYLLYDVQNALQMYFILPVLYALLAISSLYHVILWLCTRKKELKIAVKIPLYLLPVMLLVFLNTIIPGPSNLPNQQSKLVSYDGKYTMKMDMKHSRWIVSIYDEMGKKLYSDDSSDFRGHLNVYWICDRSNRLWLYNSDDSFVYYWIEGPNGWKKVCWSSKSDKNTHHFYPPKALYPEYK